jgi:hypothetical protein
VGRSLGSTDITLWLFIRDTEVWQEIGVGAYAAGTDQVDPGSVPWPGSRHRAMMAGSWLMGGKGSLECEAPHNTTASHNLDGLWHWSR